MTYNYELVRMKAYFLRDDNLNVTFSYYLFRFGLVMHLTSLFVK